MSKTIYLLRHADTIEINEKDPIFKGRSDFKISESGKIQCKNLAKKIIDQNISFDVIYVSPLSRCIETALIVTNKPIKDLIICDELIDIDCGLWENKTLSYVSKNYCELFQKWKNDPLNFIFPNGESVLNVYNRVSNFLTNITLNNNFTSILIVTHRIVINLMILFALKLNFELYWQFKYESCKFTILEFKNGKYYLNAMNV